MKLVKGFRLLSLPFPPSPSSSSSSSSSAHEESSSHHIYLKEHFDHSNPQNAGKVLFVGNVDYFCMMPYEEIQQYLRILFERFGEIESISISEQDSETTRFAHVLFQKKSILKYVLSTMTDADYAAVIQKDVLPYLQSVRPVNILEGNSLQLIRQRVQQLFPMYDVDIDDFQKNVNEFMMEFDEKERQELFDRRDTKNQADEEGFVTVVSRNKRKHDEALRNGKPAKRSHKKKKTSELKNFYSFQIKEQKMKQLDILRKKFEENKSQIQRMREQRKFNPF